MGTIKTGVFKLWGTCESMPGMLVDSQTENLKIPQLSMLEGISEITILIHMILCRCGAECILRNIS